jgi:hypothetical protein
MNFLGGSLPNVMFIIGVLAIGLGLGIELKLVPLSKEIDKTGRIGAMVVGAILVAGSLYIYLNPSLTNQNQATPTPASVAQAAVVTAPTNNAQAVAVAPTVVSPAAPTAASLPTETPAPSAAPTATASPVATATPAPTATALPTAVPPPQIPDVMIPDLHDLSEKEAQDKLKKLGLQARKVDKCTGSDQGDEKGKKHSVLCQNPPANAAVPPGTTVEYVVR